MNMNVSRRAFLKGTSAGVAGTAIGAFGFGGVEAAHAAAVRPFRLAHTTENRSICPYCSVSCGMMLFASESQSEPGKMEIIHVEGDSDNPVNRGTLCPKGSAVIDFIRSETRVKHPMYRAPGSDSFEQVTWDFAMERIARVMKDDRDENFIEANNDGLPVSRWTTAGFLASSTCNNEAGWLTYKFTRGLGMVQVENQARI